MCPDGNEQFLVQGTKFSNPELKEFAKVNNLPCEKVGFTPLNNGGWELNNVSRREGYELDPNASQPLPTRINEKLYIEVLNSIRTLTENPEVCVNAIIVKVPKKVNYRVGYLEIVDFAHAWVF